MTSRLDRAPVTTTDVLISGGGTGGHVFPALALADELVARGHDRDRIRFVGAARGLEATAVPAAGFAIDLLPGTRPRAQRVARRDRAATSARPTTPRSRSRVRWSLVGRLRPRVVVGVGGYASLPALVAARACAASPRSSTSPTRTPAWRTGSRCAWARAPRSPSPGTPLRGRWSPATRSGPPSPRWSGPRWPRPAIAVVGGSLGARSLNEAALGSLRPLARPHRPHDPPCHREPRLPRVQHELAAQRGAGDRLSYQLVPFEEHMEVVYTEATVVVSRSGGMTAELTTVGMPSVLVPLPGAPGDHQTANADALVAAGAAVKIPDAELDRRAPRHRARRAARRPRSPGRDERRPRAPSAVPTPPRASPTWWSAMTTAGGRDDRDRRPRPRPHANRTRSTSSAWAARA